MAIELAQILELPGTSPIEGPLPTLEGGGYKFSNLASIVTNALPFVYAISGILLFIYLIWGGFNYLTSGGDPKKAEVGRNKVTNAFLGFIVIFASYWIVQVVDWIFGLGIYTTPTP